MLLGACRKPRPSDPSWRGSLWGAGEAPTCQHTGSVAHVAPALSPVHLALLLLLGRAAPQPYSQGHCSPAGSYGGQARPGRAPREGGGHIQT